MAWRFDLPETRSQTCAGGEIERTRKAMNSSLKFLTFVAVLAIGAGVLGGAQDALES